MANIQIRIDVTKISKGKLYKGEKGTYLNAVMIETPNGEYGDFMIVEEQTKAERDAREKGQILGNGKYFGKKRNAVNETVNKERVNNGDDLPF